MALSPLPPLLMPARKQVNAAISSGQQEVTFVSQLLNDLIAECGSSTVDGTKCTLASCAVNYGWIAGLVSGREKNDGHSKAKSAQIRNFKKSTIHPLSPTSRAHN